MSSKDSSTKRGRRSKFSVVEDARLRKIAKEYGANQWEFIAQMMPGRTARQCRDRYQNYLNPKFTSNEWAIDEDELLMEKLFKLGPNISKISPFFPHRSKNSISNRIKNGAFQRKYKESYTTKLPSATKTSKINGLIKSIDEFEDPESSLKIQPMQNWNIDDTFELYQITEELSHNAVQAK